jgi:hypothetical protein
VALDMAMQSAAARANPVVQHRDSVVSVTPYVIQAAKAVVQAAHAHHSALAKRVREIQELTGGRK